MIYGLSRFFLSFLSSRILWGTHNPRFSFSSVWQNCPIVKTNTFKEITTVYLSPRYKPRYDEGLEGLKKYIRYKVVSLYRSYFPYILLLKGLAILFVKPGTIYMRVGYVFDLRFSQ